MAAKNLVPPAEVYNLIFTMTGDENPVNRAKVPHAKEYPLAKSYIMGVPLKNFANSFAKGFVVRQRAMQCKEF